MTTIIEQIDFAIEAAKSYKEDAARRREKAPAPIILCFRGAKLAAIVQMLRYQGSADLIAVARVAASGFDTDLMVLTFETWMAAYDGPLEELEKDAGRLLNPLTGKPWATGEMQDAVDNHDALAKGWVQDSIVVNAVNRAGDIGFASLRFTTVGRRVEWVDGDRERHLYFSHAAEGDGTELGGDVPAALREIMMDGFTFGTIAPNHESGMHPERAQAIKDTIVARMLTNPPVPHLPPCLVALESEPGSIRDQTIKERAHTISLGPDRLK